MSLKFYLFLVTCFVVVGVASADIFGDLFKWDILSAFSDNEDEEPASKREEENSEQNSCTCTGMKCDCCVDFNISSLFHIGSPGCVNMRYLSKEEGVLLNITYGERLLHSQIVTNQNKKGTCMSIFSYFAQLCARFSDLKEKDKGMVGCLNFEPTVLGEVTSQYPVGCFNMGPDGMFVDESLENLTDADDDDDSKEQEKTSQKPEEDDEQSFIEAVNQSAQESLDFITNLLGFDRNANKDAKNSTIEIIEEKGRQTIDKHLEKGKSLIKNVKF